MEQLCIIFTWISFSFWVLASSTVRSSLIWLRSSTSRVRLSLCSSSLASLCSELCRDCSSAALSLVNWERGGLDNQTEKNVNKTLLKRWIVCTLPVIKPVNKTWINWESHLEPVCCSHQQLPASSLLLLDPLSAHASPSPGPHGL